MITRSRFVNRPDSGGPRRRLAPRRFHFCSKCPARRIPNVKVTRTPNIIEMNPVANRATGKTPFVKATCIVKYLVKPAPKKENEIDVVPYGFNNKPMNNTKRPKITVEAPNGRT